MLASFLPRDHDDEKPIALYDQSPPTVRRGGEEIDGMNEETEPINEEGVDINEGGAINEGSEVATVSENRSIIRRRIKLRNHLLDVLTSHLTTETNQFDVKYVHCITCTCTCKQRYMYST